MNLQYTDDLRFQNEVLLVNRIEERLAALNLLDKTVVFVGDKARLNNAILRGEHFGQSAAAAYLLHDFAKTQGIIFKKSEKEKLEKHRQSAYFLSKEMPNFPHKESVKDTEDFVIVKLDDLRF